MFANPPEVLQHILKASLHLLQVEKQNCSIFASSSKEQIEIGSRTQKRHRESIFKIKHPVHTPDCKKKQRGNNLSTYLLTYGRSTQTMEKLPNLGKLTKSGRQNTASQTVLERTVVKNGPKLKGYAQGLAFMMTAR